MFLCLFICNLAFAADYTLTVENGTGSGVYSENTEVLVSADTPLGMFHFAYWNPEDSFAFSNNFNPCSIFKMPNENSLISAVFHNYSVLYANFNSEFYPDDLIGSDEFAYDLDVYGNTAVVSAHRSSVGAVQNGCVFVYQKQVDNSWLLSAKLADDTPGNFDNFGSAVSINANRIAVGASFNDFSGTDSGSVFIFEKQDDNSWVKTAEFAASDSVAGDSFGLSVELEGNVLCVGASRQSGGLVYVFEFDGSSWIEKAKLQSLDSIEKNGFGQSISLAGNLILIGAYSDDFKAESAGCAYLFEKQDGTWTQISKLFADDASAYDSFGFAVSLSGTTAAIGARYDDDAGESSGSVYIFKKSDNSAKWLQVSKIIASNPTPNDCFGRSLCLIGDRLIVGAYGKSSDSIGTGAAYLFLQNNGNWIEQAILQPDNLPENSSFAYSVGMSKNNILSGTVYKNNGSVYSYDISTAHTLKVISGSGSGAYQTGEKVIVKADSPKEGTYFKNWSSVPEGILDDSLALETFLIMPDDDVEITANYVPFIFNVNYIASEGGSIDGELSQDIEFGHDGSTVIAVPDDGYHFVQWSDGLTNLERFETDVRENMELSATFSLQTFTLVYTANDWGHLDGETIQDVEFGKNALPVTAIPDKTYHFVKWSDGVLDNPRIDSDITGELNVNAIFAMNDFYNLSVNGGEGSGVYPVEYSVSLKAKPYDGRAVFKSWKILSGGGVIDNPNELHTTYHMPESNVEIGVNTELGYILNVSGGTGTGAYISGTDVKIKANTPEPGLKFSRWIGDVDYLIDPSAEESTVFIKNKDISLQAVFIQSDDVDLPITLGSSIYFYAKDINNMDSEFSANPKIIANIIDKAGKQSSNSLKVSNKINKLQKSDYCQALWNSKVTLFDYKSLKSALKAGTSTIQYFLANPIKSLNVTFTLKAKNSLGEECELDNMKANLVPPEIMSVNRWDGEKMQSIHPAGIVVLKGRYFGTSSLSAALEYKDLPSGKMKQRRLKILKNRLYENNQDYLFMQGDSLNPDYGNSELWLEMPKKLWKNWEPGNYNIILNNKIGITTASVNIQPVSINSEPSAFNDEFLLQAGDKKYLLNVLSNDSDSDSDRISIVLFDHSSLQGAKLAITKDKLTYTLPDDISLPFRDAFSYNLMDANTPFTATANVLVVIDTPKIDIVSTWDGTNVEDVDLHSDSTLLIHGKNWGINPKIILEGPDGDIEIKPDAPQFCDYNGRCNKSFTDLNNGNSMMKLRLPGTKKLLPGAYYIKIINNFGKSNSVKINIIDSQIDTPPVAVNDSIKVFSGEKEYFLNVLVNDTDVQSDFVSIKLISNESALGAKISVDKTSNQIKYIRASNVFAEFDDSLTYKLVDSNGRESNTANVKVSGIFNK